MHTSLYLLIPLTYFSSPPSSLPTCNYSSFSISLSLLLFCYICLFYFWDSTYTWWASQMAREVKNLPANAEDARHAGSITGLGSSPGVGNGNLLQYSCLENSMEPGGLQCMETRSQTGHIRDKIAYFSFSVWFINHNETLSHTCQSDFHQKEYK